MVYRSDQIVGRASGVSQVDEDETPIPIGKGAVFVPRMSEQSLEPDVQLADSTGKVVLTGSPGKKFCLIPGTYSVLMGNGTTKQRIVKWVVVDEGRITPLFPTWSGLQVDVVSESNIPFKGSYELVRLDEFEPFGRGYGRDPNQAEHVKSWILKPGLYKIFGAGGSYNGVTSFVTVRLLPGELTQFVAVEDSVTGKIISGGVTPIVSASRKLTSHWKYGLDVGGSILFNSSNDTNNSAIVFLTNVRVNHKRSKGEWDTKFFFDEELNFSDLRAADINNTADDFRIYSLYIWRIMPWLGPYGRMQFETNFFPVYDRFDQSSQSHLFLVTGGGDTAVKAVDSSSKSMRLKPSVSPIDLDLGIGANVDAITSGVFDAKVRLGLGYSQHNIWGQYQDITADTASLKTKEKDPSSVLTANALATLLDNFRGDYKILQKVSDTVIITYGPEASIDGTLRLGNLITAEGEVIVQFPILPILQEHAIRPVDWVYWVNTTVSWRISNSVTLDYLYTYQFSQPTANGPKIDLSQHRVWLRYSFNTSR